MSTARSSAVVGGRLFSRFRALSTCLSPQHLLMDGIVFAGFINPQCMHGVGCHDLVAPTDQDFAYKPAIGWSLFDIR